ncbi:hypothetical protein J5X84_30970 [Streptosporangiaceae bacterium NEAU-GS5]|nr:hypothetical protein [Streptosporangiaceae bacterium NEAU-GS5]
MNPPPVLRPRRTASLAIVKVTLVAATVAALAVVAIALVSPGPGRSVSTGDVEEPRTVTGARTAAQAIFDKYTSGDYGGFWDSWSSASQELISREDYLRLFQLCTPLAVGLRFEIAGVTVSGDAARVAVNRMFASTTYQFLYEDGRWRYTPDEQTRADYRSKTVEQMTSERQAAQGCA